MRNKVVVLSGAGISAESGVKTFRDEDGLWEGHRVELVATPEGFADNPELVMEFYNQRRTQLSTVIPNAGHTELVKLETAYDLTIVTQNVDDLHERAGSSHVIHLHGELKKVRSMKDSDLVMEWEGPLTLDDRGPDGAALRPHIVWFGEEVPMLGVAAKHVSEADVLIVVGTSLQVYPAAGLIDVAPGGCEIYVVDPRPYISWELSKRMQFVHLIEKNATTGIAEVVQVLLDRAAK